MYKITIFLLIVILFLVGKTYLANMQSQTRYVPQATDFLIRFDQTPEPTRVRSNPISKSVGSTIITPTPVSTYIPTITPAIITATAIPTPTPISTPIQATQLVDYKNLISYNWNINLVNGYYFDIKPLAPVDSELHFYMDNAEVSATKIHPDKQWYDYYGTLIEGEHHWKIYVTSGSKYSIVSGVWNLPCDPSHGQDCSFNQ